MELPETKKPEPEEKLKPGEITEAEARSILIRDAMERGDEESVRAIPLEDPAMVHARWERYRARFNSGPPVRPAMRQNSGTYSAGMSSHVARRILNRV